MENKFILSIESTVDLSYDYVTKRGMKVLFYTYIIDGEEHIDNMGRSENEKNNFYEALDNGALPSTSQINEYHYEQYFEELLEQGDVLHITLGTGMTPSYLNALKAKEELSTKYPNRKLIVVDSLCSSGGYGMLVDYACDMKDQGANMEEIEKWIIDNRNHIHHQFYSTNLKYFRRSGRVSGPSAIVGSILKICPLMRLNKEGKIVAYDKVRLVPNAIKKMINDILENIQDGKDYNGKFFMYHSNCLDLAKETIEKLEEALPNIKNKIVLLDIGMIIASHCGKGTVAVSYLGDERV
ncbi:MAG: DegV family protein [Bacilli bacterium]|nr:DegV family protein [Bacilli bacterium]